MDNRPLIRKYVEEVESHKQTKLIHSEAQKLLITSNAKNNELIEQHAQKLKDKDTRIEHLELVMEDVRQNTAVLKAHFESLKIDYQKSEVQRQDTETTLGEAMIQMRDLTETLKAQMMNSNVRQGEMQAQIESLKMQVASGEAKLSERDKIISEMSKAAESMSQVYDPMFSKLWDKKKEKTEKVRNNQEQVGTSSATSTSKSTPCYFCYCTETIHSNGMLFCKACGSAVDQTATKNQKQAGTSSATSTSTATFPTLNYTMCVNCYCEGTLSFGVNGWLFCNVCGSY
ncbi:unnamed protein product [Caenorhabditis nigoni]